VSLLKNKLFASASMIAVGLIAMAFSGIYGLNSLRARAEALFDEGSRQKPVSIQENLDDSAAAAQNMSRVARRYLPEDNAALVKVEDDVNTLQYYGETRNRVQQYVAFNTLYAAADTLFKELGDAALSDTDAQYRLSTYAVIQSAKTNIPKSGYNDAARTYNEYCRSAPGYFWAVLANLQPLLLFQEG